MKSVWGPYATLLYICYILFYFFWALDRVVCTLIFLSIHFIQPYYIRIVAVAFVISCFSGKCFNHAVQMTTLLYRLSTITKHAHIHTTHTHNLIICEACDTHSKRTWISMKRFFFSSLFLSLVDEENKQKSFFSLHYIRFIRLFDVVDIYKYCQLGWEGISDWNLSTKFLKKFLCDYGNTVHLSQFQDNQLSYAYT